MLSEDDGRALAVWTAGWAERTLSLFEAPTPGDSRPVSPLTASEPSPVAGCGSGRSVPSAQPHAAREVVDPAVVAAARAAGLAARMIRAPTLTRSSGS
jgi:hypothetical protein